MLRSCYYDGFPLPPPSPPPSYPFVFIVKILTTLFLSSDAMLGSCTVLRHHPICCNIDEASERENQLKSTSMSMWWLVIEIHTHIDKGLHALNTQRNDQTRSPREEHWVDEAQRTTDTMMMAQQQRARVYVLMLSAFHVNVYSSLHSVNVRSFVSGILHTLTHIPTATAHSLRVLQRISSDIDLKYEWK